MANPNCKKCLDKVRGVGPATELKDRYVHYLIKSMETLEAAFEEFMVYGLPGHPSRSIQTLIMDSVEYARAELERLYPGYRKP